MLVSIDGGVTFSEVSEVRVITDAVEVDDEGTSNIHATFTSEGLIVDIVQEGLVVRTACFLHDDIADMTR